MHICTPPPVSSGGAAKPQHQVQEWAGRGPASGQMRSAKFSVLQKRQLISPAVGVAKHSLPMKTARGGWVGGLRCVGVEGAGGTQEALIDRCQHAGVSPGNEPGEHEVLSTMPRDARPTSPHSTAHPHVHPSSPANDAGAAYRGQTSRRPRPA